MLALGTSLIPGTAKIHLGLRPQVSADSLATGVSNLRFIHEAKRLYRCANTCPGMTGVATFLTPEATDGILNLDHIADSGNVVSQVRAAIGKFCPRLPSLGSG